MAEKTVAVRCPACGKLSRLKNFVAGAKGEHVMEAGDYESLSRPGSMGGFEWTKRDMTLAELHLLADAMSTVAQRLRLRLAPVTRDLPELPTTRQEAYKYLLDAEIKARDAQNEYVFRQKEVDKLFPEKKTPKRRK